MAAVAPTLPVFFAYRDEIVSFVRRAAWSWFVAGASASLTSWFRDSAANAAADGAADSQHLAALGADWVDNPAALDRLEEASRAAGLIAVREPTHLHVQFAPAGFLAADPRAQVLRA